MQYSTARKLLQVNPAALTFAQLCKYRSDILTLYWGLNGSWSIQYLTEHGYLEGIADDSVTGFVPRDMFMQVNVTSALNTLDHIWSEAIKAKEANA